MNIGASLALLLCFLAANEEARASDWLFEKYTASSPGQIRDEGAVLHLHGDHLYVGAPGDVVTPGAVLRYPVSNGIPVTHDIALQSPSPIGSDQFGQALAADSAGLLVGAPTLDAVYRFDGDSTSGNEFLWELGLTGDVGRALWSTVVASDGGGSASLSFISRPEADGAIPASGVVSAVWSKAGDIDWSNMFAGSEPDESFGEILAVYAHPCLPGIDTVCPGMLDMAIAAPGSSGNGLDDVGRVEVRRLLIDPSGESVTIQQFDILRPVPAVASGHFGSALAFVRHSSGRLLVAVGARGGPDAGSESGSVHVYAQEADGSWALQQRLSDPVAAGGDEFGRALAWAGDDLLVGAPRHDPPVVGGLPKVDAGGVFAYEESAAGDIHFSFKKLLTQGTTTGERFGSSLAYSDGYLYVGAPARANARGAVAQWRRTQKVTIFQDGATGNITSQPSGINCSALQCENEISVGSRVTLYASAPQGKIFTGWTGACVDRSPCEIEVSEAVYVTANYADAVELGVYAQRLGGGLAPGAIQVQGEFLDEICATACVYRVIKGSNVFLTAMPAGTGAFHSWQSDPCLSAGPVCTINDMTSDAEVTALFSTDSRTLAITFQGNGEGSVDVQFEKATIPCDATCVFTLMDGSPVMISAVAKPGHEFVAWGGSCSGTSPDADCDLLIEADHEVQVTFAVVGQSDEPIFRDSFENP